MSFWLYISEFTSLIPLFFISYLKKYSQYLTNQHYIHQTLDTGIFLLLAKVSLCRIRHFVCAKR